MLTTEEKKQLERDLYEIADILKRNMQTDEDGYWWNTIHYDSATDRFSYHIDSSIWNGTAGIGLFFLALYTYRKDPYDLEIAEKATDKLLKEASVQSQAAYSLYDGVCGIIYLCLQLFEQSQKERYLLQAKALVEKHRQAIYNETTEDLLSGTAGNLLAFALLYHHSQDQAILQDVKRLIEKLTEDAKISHKGIKWGKNRLSVDSLCGFSHGASGIAHALLQVGHYFSCPELHWLAEQALCYETQYYDPQINNWMDLRWTTSHEQLPDLFKWERNTFLAVNFDVNAWAHGAAGIGIARLYAYQLTKKDYYLTETKAVLTRSILDLKEKKKKSHLLFSGYCGLADFFILYWQTFKDNHPFHQAVTIARSALAEGKQHGHQAWGTKAQEDHGLLTGSSGIGLTVLRILSEGSIPSILHPTLPAPPKEKKRAFSLVGLKIKQHLYSRHFKRTLILLEERTCLAASVYTAEDLNRFVEKIEQIVATRPVNEREYLDDIFSLEKATLEMWKENKGHRCFYTRLAILKERLDKNDGHLLPSTRFILNPFIRIIHTQWNWTEEFPIIAQKSRYWQVLYSSDNQIHHFAIGPFAATILSHLQSALTISELEQKIQEEKQFVSSNLREKLTAQLKELLQSYFIRTYP